MIVYLIDKATNKIVQTIENAIAFGDNYVMTESNGCKGKAYCDDTQYYSDKEI